MRRTVFAIVAVAALGVTVMTCSPVYVFRAGIEEARILSRRRPIPEVVNDPATRAETRDKLRLVLDARTFAREALDLDVGDSYTTYSWVERDTLALVLSAARKDRFEAHTWWFPIVGHVPYKGYFDSDDALDAARALEARGYDTYLRPTSAFSTLGWFNDPLLSTIVDYDDVSLASTVIHELSHNTLYLPSRVSFNESFANFVGDRGAIALFCDLEGPDGERCTTARARWHDNLVFGEYLQALIGELERLYGREDLSTEQVVRRRERVFERARERFARDVEPRLRTDRFRGFERTGFNNARLIAWRLYYDRLDRFEAVYRRHDGDLAGAIAAIRAAVRDADDPFHAVATLASP
ncbi:MAG: aminopeptidase [Gemmatimonadota bacterium]